jgi:hypothetical protein
MTAPRQTRFKDCLMYLTRLDVVASPPVFIGFVDEFATSLIFERQSDAGIALSVRNTPHFARLRFAHRRAEDLFLQTILGSGATRIGATPIFQIDLKTTRRGYRWYVRFYQAAIRRSAPHRYELALFANASRLLGIASRTTMKAARPYTPRSVSYEVKRVARNSTAAAYAASLPVNS